jgi:cyclase
VVKGVNFEGITDVADPVELAEFYNGNGADELVLYDITASIEGRMIFADVLKAVAERVSIPFTVGGGINSIDDIERVLEYGADKVSINSGAIRNPSLIAEAAGKYGSERVVLAIDCKRADGKFMVFTGGGRESTGMDMLEWARKGEADGAGEIVLNSIDTDGVRGGFDLEMLEALSKAVSIPIVASGGAGKKEDFLELFRKLPVIDAGLAASIFHSKQLLIADLKSYLGDNL